MPWSRVPPCSREGAGCDAGGNFFAPTVLSDVPLTARVFNDEPFGPVAAIPRLRDPRGGHRQSQPVGLRPGRLMPSPVPEGGMPTCCPQRVN